MIMPLEKPGTPEELIHFGVRGMKWGVRKEKETSGSSGGTKQISAKKERRAQKHEAKAFKAQKEIDKRTGRNPIKHPYDSYSRQLFAKERDTHLKAAKDIREGHFTDFQKKVIIGTSAAAAILATYGTYKAIDSGMVTQFRNRRVPFNRNSTLSGKKSVNEIMQNVVKPINEGYGKDLGTSMNCRRCTFAYEMRRRGLDVKSTRSLGGTGQYPGSLIRAKDPYSKIDTGEVATKFRIFRERGKGPFTKTLLEHPMGDTLIFNSPRPRSSNPFLDAFFDSDKERPKKVTDAIFDHLSKYGSGARGELGVQWRGGRGAHSMAFEVINGRAHIFDTQTGKHYTRKEFLKLAKNIDMAGSTRLDNVNLNTAFLRRWVINV